MNLAFYTGPNCELCDHALAIIDDLRNSETTCSDVTLHTFNIRENTDHYHLYATRIPVLKREDTQDELGWPFDIESLRAFITK